MRSYILNSVASTIGGLSAKVAKIRKRYFQGARMRQSIKHKKIEKHIRNNLATQRIEQQDKFKVKRHHRKMPKGESSRGDEPNDAAEGNGDIEANQSPGARKDPGEGRAGVGGQDM
jgi:hypothetical protein